ncbi:unnamed protein product [Moneuplotes crassus]|uniref:Uncharacterized protein n=1 Tax=Euplotes crassus TaxID=5936 RepID=A0AAD1XUU2_EUPCR|nr:unnamed protein product [Moneuplotes crassus]
MWKNLKRSVSSFLDPNISTVKKKLNKQEKVQKSTTKMHSNEDDSIRNLLADLRPSLPEISTKQSLQDTEMIQHSSRMSFLKNIEQKVQKYTKRIPHGDTFDSLQNISKIIDNATEKLPSNIIDYKSMSLNEPSFLSKVKDNTLLALEKDITRTSNANISKAGQQMGTITLENQVKVLREALTQSKRYCKQIDMKYRSLSKQHRLLKQKLKVKDKQIAFYQSSQKQLFPK